MDAKVDARRGRKNRSNVARMQRAVGEGPSSLCHMHTTQEKSAASVDRSRRAAGQVEQEKKQRARIKERRTTCRTPAVRQHAWAAQVFVCSFEHATALFRHGTSVGHTHARPPPHEAKAEGDAHIVAELGMLTMLHWFVPYSSLMYPCSPHVAPHEFFTIQYFTEPSVP